MDNKKHNVISTRILKLMSDFKTRTAAQIADTLECTKGSHFDTNIQTLIAKKELSIVGTTKAANARVNTRLLRMAVPEEESSNPFEWQKYVGHIPEKETLHLVGRTIHYRDFDNAV